MLEKFREHIETKFPSLKEKKLLIACSGGLDSVVLVHLLSRLGYRVSVAHCNFSLRAEESDADETFVKQLAENLHIPVFVKKFDTNQYAEEENISIQMAARALRYRWFFELLEEKDFDFLITAHHLDDDFETFLINTIRSTGLRGLTGIPEFTGRIIRPMLPFSRTEIYTYAKTEQIAWREDSSNKSSKYLRNKIRLDVIPQLKEAEPRLLQNFKSTQSHLQSNLLLLEDYIGLVFSLVVKEEEDGFTIDIERLKKFPNTKALLYELLSPFGFTQWQDVCDLPDAQTGKQVFSKTHVLLKNRDVLLLREIKNEEKKEILIRENENSVTTPVSLSFTEVAELLPADKNTVFVDKEKLKFPLALRRWREGDVFFPFGMEGKKKISKFFKDEKLSLFAKNKIWLLCNGNEIVWVVGHRADRRFQVTPKTKTILKITYTDE